MISFLKTSKKISSFYFLHFMLICFIFSIIYYETNSLHEMFKNRKNSIYRINSNQSVDLQSYIHKNLSLINKYTLKINNQIDQENSIKLDSGTEWEALFDTYYFKKSAVYFFKDSNFILVFFVSKRVLIENLKLKLKIYHLETSKKLFEINLEKVIAYRYKLWRNFDTDHGLYTLRANFKIKRLKYYLENNKLLMKVFPYFSKQVITKKPLDVKIKDLKAKSILKKEAMICTKMFFLKKKDFNMLERWFTMNSNIGFDKIVLFNNSIPNTAEFNKLFYNYKDLVEIKQMHYFPDIINNSNNFLKEYIELYDPIKKHCGSVILFQILNYNECYLDNIDKYKYIGIFDIDETVIPRPLVNRFRDQNARHNYSFENYLKKNKCIKKKKHQNNIVNYINMLRKQLKFGYSRNMYFQNAFYLSNDILSKLFEKFNEFQNQSKKFSYEYFIPIEYNSNQHNLTTHVKFRISSFKENEHFINLYNIYKNILIPFYQKIKGKKEIYDRFFYLLSNIDVPGKSIYDTSEYAPITSHHMPYRNFVEIPYRYGHSSHFRKFLHLKPSVTGIKISDIYFNSNYLNCYYSIF